MLPPFNENGYLPPGIHRCDIDALAERFGSGSPEREIEIQELLDFMAWALKAGIQRVIVNGSFGTAKISPNDVDIVILLGGDYPKGEAAFDLQETRWPFLQVFIAADELDLEAWALGDFGTDRNRQVKGVVEVLL